MTFFRMVKIHKLKDSFKNKSIRKIVELSTLPNRKIITFKTNFSFS